MDLRIASVETFLVEVPQTDPIIPYQSRYRAGSSTSALLIRLETKDGIVGWGETPQRYLGEQLTGREAEQLRPKLLSQDATYIEALYCEWGLDGGYVQSGVEMAMWDVLGKAARLPLYRLWGGLVRPRIELAACMGIRGPAHAGRTAKLYVDQGFTTMKTKAGRDPEEDLAMVRGIRDAVGDQLQLRVDPNTGYEPDVCLQLAKDLESFGLQYLEQPMAADLLAESADLRRQTTTPLALNESVTTLAVVREILERNAAAVLLPDTYQCGGLKAVKSIADLAASANVPCVMHCAHDLGLKTAAMLHLAASTENFPLANDCTYYALEDDVLQDRLVIRDGCLTPPHRPGLGVDVDLGRIRRFQLAASG